MGRCRGPVRRGDQGHVRRFGRNCPGRLQLLWRHREEQRRPGRQEATAAQDLADQLGIEGVGDNRYPHPRCIAAPVQCKAQAPPRLRNIGGAEGHEAKLLQDMPQGAAREQPQAGDGRDPLPKACPLRTGRLSGHAIRPWCCDARHHPSQFSPPRRLIRQTHAATKWPAKVAPPPQADLKKRETRKPRATAPAPWMDIRCRPAARRASRVDRRDPCRYRPGSGGDRAAGAGEDRAAPGQARRPACAVTGGGGRHARWPDPIPDWAALEGCDAATFIQHAFLLAFGREVDKPSFDDLRDRLARGTTSRARLMQDLLAMPEAAAARLKSAAFRVPS